MELNKAEQKTTVSINFVPESDKFVGAAKEYRGIWLKNGEKIIKTIEQVSSLNFLIRQLEATIYEGKSQSHPLRLRASNSKEIKQTALIHELCHILFVDNHLKFELEIHKVLNLILYDTLEDLYGKGLADNNVQAESKLSPEYKEAWEWTLAFNKEERGQKLEELLKIVCE